MSPRILILPAALALMLLIACGGGSKSSSPTPSEIPSPTPTLEPVACASDDLYTALISSENLDGQYLSIGITNVRTGGCFLSGPPAINWYSAAGEKLAIPAATSAPCQPQAGDYTTCVYSGAVTLPSGAPTPAADVNGQAVAIVGVSAIDAAETCPPSLPARFVSLQFPGVTPDLRVELTEDVTFACSVRVTLQGYGPLPTPQE